MHHFLERVVERNLLIEGLFCVDEAILDAETEVQRWVNLEGICGGG